MAINKLNPKRSFTVDPRQQVFRLWFETQETYNYGHLDPLLEYLVELKTYHYQEELKKATILRDRLF